MVACTRFWQLTDKVVGKLGFFNVHWYIVWIK